MRTRATYEDTISLPAGTAEARSRTKSGGNWGAWSSWGGNYATPLSTELSGESIIIDDITPAAGVKTVTHTKRKFRKTYNPDLISEYTPTTWYEYRRKSGTSNLHRFSWGDYGQLSLDNITASYPKTVNQLKSEAMHKFHDTVEVEGLLNAVELPQLMWSARSIRDYVLDFRKDRTLRRALRRDAELVAGGFLGWSFGIAPLLSDMKKVDQALKQGRKIIDAALREKSMYAVTCRSYGSLSVTTTASGYSSNPNNDDTSWWHTGINLLDTPVLLVGCRGRRRIAYSIPALQKADYLLRRFFASGPASFAWERIPFSFVVDWFVNLSGVVDALDNVLTGVNKDIHSIWMSEKWSALIPVYKHKYSGWVSDSDGKQTALNEMSYYHREALSLDPTISASGRFGKKQAAISVALLHQIVADLRRKLRR